MGKFRTSRPMVVEALQCKAAKTIATDLGFINVKEGDWVVCGEGGETYILDDEFFHRTFVSAQEDPQIPKTSTADRELRKQEAPKVASPQPRHHAARTRSAPAVARRRRISSSR